MSLSLLVGIVLLSKPRASLEDRRNQQIAHVDALIERGDWKGLVGCCSPSAEFIACRQEYGEEQHSGLKYNVRVWHINDFLHPKADLKKAMADLKDSVRLGHERSSAVQDSKALDSYGNAAPFRELPFPGPGFVGQAASNAFWKIVLGPDLKVAAVYDGAH